MSVQTAGAQISPSKATDLSPKPKKRKHVSDEKEAVKRKKKQRKEGIESPVAVHEPSTEKPNQKKKRKSKEAKEVPVHTNGELSEQEDVDLPDAPLAEQSSPEALPQTSSTAVEAETEENAQPEDILDLLESADPTSFYTTRLSLYLSIPAISLETSTSSLLATHLAPLLLTYFPPAHGIVLGFADAVLSAKPANGINVSLVAPPSGDIQPQAEILSRTADDFGVCWVWLTTTFLVFRPEKGDELHGWTNVTSEGFVGLVSYNYFQAAVDKTRIPADWNWSGPSKDATMRNRKKSKKGRLRDEDGYTEQQENGRLEDGDDGEAVDGSASHSQIVDDGGFFADATGSKVSSTLKFRVVDTEPVPAQDKHKWSLQIDGTLLDDEAEQRVREEEQAKFERAQQHSRAQTPGDAFMSGALGLSREVSVASGLSGQTPMRHRLAY